MNYVIEKTEDGFILTFAGEDPQFFADIVELEDAVVARLRDEYEATQLHRGGKNAKIS